LQNPQIDLLSNVFLSIILKKWRYYRGFLELS